MQSQRLSRLVLAALLTTGSVASAAVVTVFDDNYGTDPGHVAHGTRWTDSGVFVPTSITDNATSFTASSSIGTMQIQIPFALVGDGTATPISDPLTFSITTQYGAGSTGEDMRYLFVNPNVSGTHGASYTWTVTNDGGGTGRLFGDAFGGGTQLASGIDIFAPHTFVLTAPNPLINTAPGGDATLTVDGSATYSITPTTEDDDSSFIRLVGGSSNIFTVEHTSLTYAPLPEPSCLTLIVGASLLQLRRNRKQLS